MAKQQPVVETWSLNGHSTQCYLYREAIKYRFDGSSLIGPEKRKKKAIRTKNCLSDSEFFPFRFVLSIAGIGQSSGSPFFGYLFWRSKKSDCPRGTSGIVVNEPRHSIRSFAALRASGERHHPHREAIKHRRDGSPLTAPAA